jgi:hypothetical protein
MDNRRVSNGRSAGSGATDVGDDDNRRDGSLDGGRSKRDPHR